MFRFDIQHLLKLKGGKTPAAFLRQNGFSRTSSFHLSGKNVKRLTVNDIKKLCNLFNCTPNDLFLYEESGSKPIPPNSSMRKLIRTPFLTMPEIVDDISLDQAKELMEKIREMKKQT
jgi:DNA-binding Xre family transcriptional regulator